MHVFLKWGPFINYVSEKGARWITWVQPSVNQGDVVGLGGGGGFRRCKCLQQSNQSCLFKDCDEMA